MDKFVERRRRALTDDDIEALARRLRPVISGSYPREHHDFVALLIVREKRRLVMWEKVKANVVGWVVVVLIGSAITGLGYTVLEWIRGRS